MTEPPPKEEENAFSPRMVAVLAHAWIGCSKRQNIEGTQFPSEGAVTFIGRDV